MRQRFRDVGCLPLLKFAGVALIASLSSACSTDVMRLSDNAFSNPFTTRNDPATTGSVSGSPTPRVQSSTLGAPKSSGFSQPMPAAVSSATKVAAAGNAPVLGNANGWSATGGTPVTLGAGDTVEALSGRYGVPVSALRSVNGLSGNSQPAAGSQFIIPAFNPGGSAGKAASTVSQASQGYQQLKSAPTSAKESLQSLNPAKSAAAKKEDDEDDEDEPKKVLPKAPTVPGFKPLEKKASAVNDKVDSANKVIAKAQDAKTKVTAAAPVKQAPASKTTPQKAEDDDDDEVVKTAKPVIQPVHKTPATAKAPEASKEPAKTTAKAKEDPETTGSVDKNAQEFRWPARGRVISGFGSKGPSGNNDGINISLPEGTPVKAAEGGTVAYAGEEIKGYGKMVLIRHPNGYVSAYAHNGDINVKRGETVKRGQVIAKSGQTGNVTSPQLHFELRKGSEPVDPSKHLE